MSWVNPVLLSPVQYIDYYYCSDADHCSIHVYKLNSEWLFLCALTCLAIVSLSLKNLIVEFYRFRRPACISWKDCSLNGEGNDTSPSLKDCYLKWSQAYSDSHCRSCTGAILYHCLILNIRTLYHAFCDLIEGEVTPSPGLKTSHLFVSCLYTSCGQCSHWNHHGPGRIAERETLLSLSSTLHSVSL